MNPTRDEAGRGRDLTNRQPRLMGFDGGPQPLPLGPFQAFRGEAEPGTNKGDVLNCCRKMPSLWRAGLPGSFNLPKQLRMSPSYCDRSVQQIVSEEPRWLVVRTRPR